MNAHFEFVLILSEFLWPFGADVSSSLSVVTGTCWPLRFIKTLCPDTSRLVLITGKDKSFHKQTNKCKRDALKVVNG